MGLVRFSDPRRVYETPNPSHLVSTPKPLHVTKQKGHHCMRKLHTQRPVVVLPGNENVRE